MNDISNLTHLALPVDAQDTQLQLPASAYFDEALFEQEMIRIFAQSARYVGHEQTVPNVGDWRRLPQDDGARVLVRSKDGVQLLSNVCRHRQALMLGGEAGNVCVTGGGDAKSVVLTRGNLAATSGNIVCPLHRWTYDGHGELIGAPEYERKPCRNLERFPLHDFHGLLYVAPTFTEHGTTGCSHSAVTSRPLSALSGSRIFRLT